MNANWNNLYNYDARLYDPVVGRFASADSFVPDWYDPQSLNKYVYCRNNPLIYTDPSGKYRISPDLLEKKPVLKNLIMGAEKMLRTGGAYAIFEKQLNTSPYDIIGPENGPEIRIGEITQEQKEYLQKNKKVDNAKGWYNSGDEIFINEERVDRAEEGDEWQQYQLERTIIHETAHWAWTKNKAPRDENGNPLPEPKDVEWGKAAEDKVYGPNSIRRKEDEKPQYPYPTPDLQNLYPPYMTR